MDRVTKAGSKAKWLLIAAVFVAMIVAASTMAPPDNSSVNVGRSSTSTTEADKNKGDAPQQQLDDGTLTTSKPADAALSAEQRTKAVGAADESSAAGGFAGGEAAVATEDADVAPIAGHEAPAMNLKIIQTGDVTVQFKAGQLDEGFSDISAMASSLGGYVLSSNMSGGSRYARTGHVAIRIPNAKFGEALRQIKHGGKVQSINISTEDVSQEYVDAKSRLRHDRAIEQRLLVLLGKTNTVGQTLAIQDRLSDIQEQIEIQKGRIKYLDAMTSMSTINVTLNEKGKKKVVKKPVKKTEWGVRKSFGKAAHNFVSNVNRAIVWTGGTLPALLLFGGMFLAGRSWMRRRNRS